MTGTDQGERAAPSDQEAPDGQPECICLGGKQRIEARIGTDPRCPVHGKRAHLSVVP